MRHWLIVFSLLIAHPAGFGAEPFQEAEVTKKFNLVSLLFGRDSRPVALGDVVKGDRALKTGGDSRAELQFPDLTITRVGSNALFRFLPGQREIILENGTVLFSSPGGAGGGKVQAGAITAAVTGTDMLVSLTKGGATQPLAKQTFAKQDLTKMTVNLAAGTKEVAKQQAAIQDAAAQNANLANKVAAITQGVAKQLPVTQDVAEQAKAMKDLQQDLKEQAAKLEMASNLAAKQAATLAKIVGNMNGSGQVAPTQTATTQAAATQTTKLDATLGTLTQGAAQQEAAAQKIANLTDNVAAANQAVAQAATATQKAAAQQEALKLMADLQQAMKEQNANLDAFSNMLAKQAALKDQIVQNMGGEAPVTQQAVKQEAASQGTVKVIDLTGKVLVYFTQNQKENVTLRPGQMVTIPPGATEMPPVTTINLGVLISTSTLIRMGPLPSQAILERSASNQQASLLARVFPGVNELLSKVGSQAAQAMTAQTAQISRNAGNNPPSPPQPPPQPPPQAQQPPPQPPQPPPRPPQPPPQPPQPPPQPPQPPPQPPQPPPQPPQPPPPPPIPPPTPPPTPPPNGNGTPPPNGNGTPPPNGNGTPSQGQ